MRSRVGVAPVVSRSTKAKGNQSEVVFDMEAQAGNGTLACRREIERYGVMWERITSEV